MLAVFVLVAMYALVGFLYGSWLKALTAPGPDSWSWGAFLHGALWPLSILGLWRFFR